MSGLPTTQAELVGKALRVDIKNREHDQIEEYPSPCEFSLPLEPFYGCDGCQAIAHTLLIEQARPRVCGVIFDGLRIEHQCRLRAVAAKGASTTIVYRSKFLSSLLRRPSSAYRD